MYRFFVSLLFPQSNLRLNTNLQNAQRNKKTRNFTSKVQYETCARSDISHKCARANKDEDETLIVEQPFGKFNPPKIEQVHSLLYQLGNVLLYFFLQKEMTKK